MAGTYTRPRVGPDVISSDAAEIAWAAGLWEGEGYVQTHKASRPSGTYVYARMGMSQTDEDVIRRFHSVVGCGTITDRPPRKEGHKPYWVWQLTDPQHVAEAFRPWLGKRRLDQLSSALNQDTRRKD
jgi:hypothetical protein